MQFRATGRFEIPDVWQNFKAYIQETCGDNRKLARERAAWFDELYARRDTDKLQLSEHRVALAHNPSNHFRAFRLQSKLGNNHGLPGAAMFFSKDQRVYNLPAYAPNEDSLNATNDYRPARVHVGIWLREPFKHSLASRALITAGSALLRARTLIDAIVHPRRDTSAPHVTQIAIDHATVSRIAAFRDHVQEIKGCNKVMLQNEWKIRIAGKEPQSLTLHEDSIHRSHFRHAVPTDPSFACFARHMVNPLHGPGTIYALSRDFARPVEVVTPPGAGSSHVMGPTGMPPGAFHRASPAPRGTRAMLFLKSPILGLQQRPEWFTAPAPARERAGPVIELTL